MFRKLYGPTVLLDPTPAEGGNGGENSPAKTPVVDPSAGFTAALKKYGDDATGLARESWTKAETIRVELEETRGKLPKAGAVVLDGEALAEYQAYQSLGKPGEVKTRLELVPALDGKVKAFERKGLIASAAKAHGSDGRPLGYDPDVLETLMGADLPVELVDKTEKGKTFKVAQVVEKTKDAAGVDVEKRTALDKFAESTWAKFLPSLKAVVVAAAAGTPGSGRTVVATPVTGTPERTALRLPRI
jgi:hypothetical protein